MADRGRQRRRQAGARVVAAFALAVALAGCASNKQGSPLSTAGTQPITRESALAEAQALNEEYRKRPDDPAVAMRFAESLSLIGSQPEAVAVLAAAAEKHPSNGQVLAAYGKSLIAVGRTGEAIDMLKRAQATKGGDWRTASALGLAHDQNEQHKAAREYYAQAARLAPDEPSVLNNWGLSFALDRDLPSAEKVLRRAVGMRGAEPRVRQNLALVIGLQGRFKEAEKMARMDLPPAEAEANIAYMRSMLAEPDAWSQLAKIDGDAGKSRKAPVTTASAPPRKKVGKD